MILIRRFIHVVPDLTKYYERTERKDSMDHETWTMKHGTWTMKHGT